MAICGARKRSGGTCQKHALKGSTRCRLHGGAATAANKGNAHAVKHGFYSDALLPEEKTLYERAEVGSLDDEIRLARVKLHRFVKLSGSLELREMVDSALEVTRKMGVAFDAETKSVEPYDKKEFKVAAPDYADLIIRQIDLIRKLELARKDLMADEDEDAPDSIVIKVSRARKDDA
jgi:hypothetical protein